MMLELTNERVAEIFEREGAHVFVARDGTVLLMVGRRERVPGLRLLVNAVDGHILDAQAAFDVPAAHVPVDALLQFVNHWNEAHRWPKAVVDVDEHEVQGLIHLPVAGGWTDEQLSHALGLIASCSLQLGTAVADLTSSRSWSLEDEDLARLVEQG